MVNVYARAESILEHIEAETDQRHMTKYQVVDVLEMVIERAAVRLDALREELANAEHAR